MLQTRLRPDAKTRESGSPSATYKESWGRQFLLGLYPVKDRIGVFLGGPVARIRERGLSALRSGTREHLGDDDDFAHRALGAFSPLGDPFFWEFHDCRSEVWSRKNAVLLGDAATGFLPTAGLGASMAMDSAAALTDGLSRVDPGHIDYGLKLFTRRQRERVEKAQDDSRRLGRLMFVRSSVISAVRDRIVSFYSLRRMLSDLSAVMEEQ